MEIDKERFSSERYDGSNFPLRISPVKFGDSGRYFCYCEHYPMASVTLVTVQVPPGGLSRNQSVVLNCEISQVIGSVTLAWLWMKGGRGELVKQEVLSKRNPKKMLSLTLPILSRDQLHWACAVFTESMLRAQVPLHLTLPAPEPQVLVQYKYLLSGEGQRVSLQAPAETKGTEFTWEWTSHDGSYTNTRIITIQSDGNYWWDLKKAPISKQGKYNIYLEPKLQNAGVFTFIQTKPEKVKVAQFEVFAAEGKIIL
ncbi:uncharacterized protein LOC135246532 isoform X2 [Anguilla rostrata]|uniref:uncharacterized protein LOC135246532 isoform X2 n=1 Tax=Anguilla rostrata TaxID=7938 RepID=UPI0030CEFF65